MIRHADRIPLAEAGRETAAPGWRRKDKYETLVSNEEDGQEGKTERHEQEKKGGKEGKERSG